MADKRKLIELDIDVEGIISKSVQLKKELDTLKETQKLLKESTGANTEEYVKITAQVSKVSSEYNLNQKQLSNLAQVSGDYLTIQQRVALSLDKENTSISEARQNNKELLAIRNSLNLSKESEAKLAAEINAKLDQNNQFIKENVSGYEKQKIGIGDYKTAITGALQETGLFGGQLQNVTQFAGNFTGIYSKMKGELSSSVSQIKNAVAETQGLGLAKKSLAIATETGSGALRIFKLALAATGIGLLIIGVGLLINGLSKLDPVMDKIEQLTAGVGGAIDKASSIVVRFVSNITSIGDAFSKIGKLISDPIGSIKSFSEEVGNAAKAAADLKEAEQDLGDLKDIYDVRNKNIESQINLDKIRLKSKDLTAKEEQEIEKRINDNFEQLSKNRTEVNDKTLDNALQSAINTAQELNKVDQKRLEESIRLGDIEVATKLKNDGKITVAAFESLKESTNTVIDSKNQQAESEERAQDKIEKARAKAEDNAKKADEAQKKRMEEAQKIIDKAIARSKTELELFIAQQGTRAKSLEEALKLEEQIRDKKIAISKQEFEAKKITQTEYELQVLNIKNTFLQKQSEITLGFAQIELKAFIDANKSKLDANKFLSDELFAQEIDRLERIRIETNNLEKLKYDEGLINKETYEANVKAIDDKVAEDNKALQEEKTQADLEKKAVDLENKIATDQLNSENDFAFRQAELQRNQEAELIAAKTNGANVDLINQKFAAQKKALDKSVSDFKFSQELGLIQGLKGLISEQSFLGKSLALAEIFMTTTQNATKAFTQAAVFATNPLTAPLAINANIQGGIIVATGLAQAAKISGLKLAKGAIDIDGPGSSTSDSIPAMLSRGESVINAKSTAMYKPLLSAINKAGGGVGFSDGGIPMPASVLNTFNNSNQNQPIDYDLLASKIGANVAQANRSLPSPIVAVTDINLGQQSHAQVVNGANLG